MTTIEDRRADTAVADGLELVGLVRDYTADVIGDYLARRDREQLEALIVALAAMVPDDVSVDTLLAWIRPKPKQPPGITRQLRPHGTHAAFNLHRKHSEEPCAACWTGERLYQRDAKRRQVTRRANPTTEPTTCTPVARPASDTASTRSQEDWPSTVHTPVHAQSSTSLSTGLAELSTPGQTIDYVHQAAS